MNTNVGDMPIEIFGDYISDTLDIEYDWMYLFPVVNEVGTRVGIGYGDGFHSRHQQRLCSIGNGSITTQFQNGCGFDYGFEGIVTGYGNGTTQGDGKGAG